MLFLFTRFSVYVRKFSNDSFLCVCAVIMDGLFSDEELFLTQNSVSEERVEDNFSIDSILDGLVACDEPVSQNSCKEELKQVVTEKSIKDGRTDPSNYPEAVRKIVIVDDEELEKRKECRIPPNTRINTSWAVRAWSEWALERNGMIASTFADDIIVVNLGGNFSSRRFDFLRKSKVHLNNWKVKKNYEGFICINP